MATAMPTNHFLDDINRIPFSVEKLSDKKYKEQIKREVAIAVCALLNSNGGKVEIRGEEMEGNLLSTTILDSLTRTLEQSLTSRFGAWISESVALNHGDKNAKMIAINVSKARFLVTIKYNFYRPTQKQVEMISNVQNTFELITRRCVDQPVQLGSHHKKFLKDQDCNFRENETVQFKLVMSAPSKRVTLADRMIGKSNKFSCYVSAFANHRGGHIYYGIDDDGVVQGENAESISEIKKKFEKAIQKMIWPDVIGQPKRGEHWEIFFEPVLDEKSNLIPSTFVIVIFIAPCCGGVFTEEPESYEMVEGKVERMSFTTWKKKLQPVGLNKRKLEVPFLMKRISLSPAARRLCRETHEVLTEVVNNGEWTSFSRRASEFEHKYPNNREVQLIVLSRSVMVNYRLGKIPKASTLLTLFKDCFPQAEQPMVFKVLFLSLKLAVARVSGQSSKFRDTSTDALTIAELVEPGLFTAAVLLVAASTFDHPENDAKLAPNILCIKALEHLEYVEDAPVSRADKYHAAHITLAAYNLGYNLSGKMIKKDIDKESFRKAKASIMAVNQSVCDGNPLTGYREIWFTLIQSILSIRHSKFQPEKQTKFLNAAYNYAKKAANLAKDSGLEEMVCWAQNIIQQVAVVLKGE